MAKILKKQSRFVIRGLLGASAVALFFAPAAFAGDDVTTGNAAATTTATSTSLNSMFSDLDGAQNVSVIIGMSSVAFMGGAHLIKRAIYG